jgi:uncharacterized membrane protein
VLIVDAAVHYSSSEYKAVPIPTPFVPVAIKKDGRIPGSIYGRAAVYRSGTLTILGKYNGEPTYATDINSFGDAVGYAVTNTGYRAVEYADGAFIALANVLNCPVDPVGYDGLVIDDLGDIYGACLPSDKSDAPYIARYKPGTPSVLTAPAVNTGYGLSVNGSGTFIYSAAEYASDGAATSGTGLKGAYLPLSYMYSTASWINDAGTIVGALTNNTNTYTPMNAYIYPKGGPLKILPLLNNAASMSASGINRHGTVIGSWSNSTTSGIFRYKSGVLSDITPSIVPAGNYGALPGLADSGAFVATANGQYYLIKPAAP